MSFFSEGHPLGPWVPRAVLFAVVFATLVAPAAATTRKGSWAEAQIDELTRVGVLGTSVAGFNPQGVLTQRALAAAIGRVEKLQAPPPPPPAPAPTPTVTTPTPTVTTPAPTVTAPAPPPVQVLSTIPADATIGGTEPWQVSVPTQNVSYVAFAVDGVQQGVSSHAPFALTTSQGGGLVTTGLADGTHQLAVAAHLAGGGTYVAAWTVEVANAPGAELTPLPDDPAPVPITQAPPQPTPSTPVTAPTPAPTPEPSTPAPAPVAPKPALDPHVLYHAVAPLQGVSIKELDSALVEYLDLGPAAHEIQTTLRAAGLDPPPNTGSEVVARLLDLRYTHPTPSQNGLDLLPNQDATRAEAAYSFAQVLALGSSGVEWVRSLAQSFTVPTLNPWQRRILTTAVRYVGYPYVWGGTSPTAEAPFGVEAPGGFDCSGFVWRVYKLTPYPNEGDLANVIVGRTTYVMSGEVPRSKRISADKLEPGDVMFFGVGTRSKPSQVDHTAIYMGDGWLIQSSDEGVTLTPFAGWYRQSFAWARRPLREADLT